MRRPACTEWVSTPGPDELKGHGATMAMTEKIRREEVEKRADQEYTFEWGEGEEHREYHLKPLNSIDAKFMRETRKLGEIDQMFSLLEKLADEDTLALIDGMSRKEFNEFTEKWQRWSQVTVGESSASSS
jgi:hypothetical protein